MNPLIFSLISLIKENKTLLYISTIPCIYLVIYGIYLIFGPIDLYEDGSKNYFNKNPSEKELPIVFIILKLYQYVIILIGLIFGYVFSKKLKENQNNEPS